MFITYLHSTPFVANDLILENANGSILEHRHNRVAVITRASAQLDEIFDEDALYVANVRRVSLLPALNFCGMPHRQNNNEINEDNEFAVSLHDTSPISDDILCA